MGGVKLMKPEYCTVCQWHVYKYCTCHWRDKQLDFWLEVLDEEAI